MICIANSGLSEAAQQLDSFRQQQEQRESDTVTLAKADEQAQNELLDVLKECSESNWDGENAEPIEQTTLEISHAIIRDLPPWFPRPRVYAEPDGHICLEWYTNPKKILSVSVAPDEQLHWAALIGSETMRGTCPFYGSLPQTLQELIDRLS